MSEIPGLPQRFHDTLREAMAMWNRHEFYEAHEALQEIWDEDDTESAEFVQGLLCAAVGFAKLDVDRPAGTQKMMVKANTLLRGYPPRYMSIDLPALAVAFDRCRIEAERVVAREKHTFDRALIPRLEASS